MSVDNKKRLMGLINIAKGQLALDEDTYRAMLKGATGKESLRAMGVHELEQVLAIFKQKGFKAISKANKKSSKKSNKTAVNGRLSKPSGQSKSATVDKIVAVWICMGQQQVISDASETALDAYVRRMTRNFIGGSIDSVRWLNDEQAARLLESLKRWHRRVLLERIKEQGRQPLSNHKGTGPAAYEAIVEQYAGLSEGQA